MKRTLLIILIILVSIPVFKSEEVSIDQSRNFQGPVGKFMYGKADQNSDGQSFHYINIQKIEKKYLFIRLTAYNNNQYGKMGLSVYKKGQQALLTSCLGNGQDTCFIRGSKLKENDILLIVVACQSSCRYGLYSYWGDLQHLKPNHDIKFQFQSQNPTQLFHLNLKDKLFEKIRIVLKPQTYRQPMDNLKMFLNYGLSQQPTPQNHQVTSIHVWNDAQAIFLSKQQTKDYEGVMLLITGNAKTIYVLSCQMITKSYHELHQNKTIYQYIAPKTSTFYRVSLPIQKYDQFSIKFSVFTGQVGVGFFYDKQFKQQIQHPRAEYMSDLQFLIKKSQMRQNTKQIYIQVFSADSIATYSLNFQPRQISKADQIYQYVYQFVSFKKRQIIYFQDMLYSKDQIYQNYETAEYSVKFLAINGMPNIDWRICTSEQFQFCIDVQNKEFEQNTKKILPTSISEVGLTKIFKLTIKKTDFIEINRVQKKIMVIMTLTGSPQKTNQVAIQYSNDQRVRILRDDRVIQQKVNGMGYKLYKYINNDPTVKKIDLNLNMISGKVQVSAQRKDFRSGTDTPLQINQHKFNVLQVRDKITEPIYIKIQGLINSIYTIGIAKYHQQNLGMSSVTISEDVTYNFKILPGNALNLDMNPVFQKIQLQYSSQGGPISVCVLEEEHCSKQLQLNQKIKDQGVITYNRKNINSKTFRIYNQGRQYNVLVKVIFHSGDYSHCLQRQVNQVYNQVVKHGQCFRFDLPMAADIQVTTIRQDVGKDILFFYACSRTISLKPSKYKPYLAAKQIMTLCDHQLNDISLYLAIADEKKKQFKLQYIFEYRGDVVTLKDGIGYTTKAISKQGIVKQFFYPFINIKDTQVILLNKRGFNSFKVFITNQKDKYVALSTQQQQIVSIQSNYYSSPTVKITPQLIQQAKCGQSCVLVIQILSDQEVGQQLQFTIQVTQNSVLLNQDQVRSSFLSQGSLDYYQYDNKQEGQSIYVKVSQQNVNCAKIYISNYQYPTVDNNIVQQSGNQLVFEDAEKGKYYIGVQAFHNCPYSICVSQSKTTITRIRVNQFYNIKLQENEKKFFLVRYISKESFKIMYIQKSGTVNIYANETQINQKLLKSISNNKLKYQDFSFKSSYKNSLFIDNQSQHFCQDCYYLIMVVAKTQVQSTIVISDQKTQIPLGNRKTLFDQIHKQNSTTMIKTDQVRPGKLYVKVHAGAIKVSLQYNDKIIQNQYKRQNKLITTDYNFTRAQKDWSPLIAIIKATQAPALYSIQLQSDPDIKQNHIQRVVPGQSSYLYLDNDRQGCIQGFIHKRDQQIIITSSLQNSNKLQRMDIDATLDGNDKIQINKQMVGNVMSVKFKIKQMYTKKTLPYSLCLTSNHKDSFTVSILQQDDVNLLPAGLQTIVKNYSTFVIKPQGFFIIDLFQCRGTSHIKYSTKLSQLNQTKKSQVQKIGMSGQNHAIKINQYSTTFVKIQGQLSTIVWMPVNQKQQRGIGYQKYGISSFTYKSSITSIQFQIKGVRRIMQTNTTVQSIRYYIFISNSKQKLQQAIQCQSVQDNNVAKFYVGKYDQSYLGKRIQPSIKKSTISQKFNNQTVYFNVVADMILKVPSSEQKITQNYRFIYFQQTAPVQVFTELNIKNASIKLLIVVGIVGVLVIIVIGCVFAKCIVPGLGRLKNRMFLNEDVQDKRDDSIPIPPSSQRNQIQIGNMKTDQRMR